MPYKTWIRLIFIILFLALPASILAGKIGFSERKKSTVLSPKQNEVLVKESLKQLYEAQKYYYLNYGNQQFGTLLDLHSQNLVDLSFAKGQKFGYQFTLKTRRFPSGFFVTAIPLKYGKTGKKSFYFDSSCKIRGSDKNGAEATLDDEVIDVCQPTLISIVEPQIIWAMRKLALVQEIYRNNFGNKNYGSFYQLYETGLIEKDLSFYHYYGYNFSLFRNSQSQYSDADFRIYSQPSTYNHMGFRSFYIDRTGILRGADHQGEEANENDPPIK